MKPLILAILALPLMMSTAANAQNLTAKEIIEKADQKQRGETSVGELKMTIVRPTWTREMVMKSWSKGTEYMLILVTAPARDKGTAFLKRENEIWNWQPTIDRVIKMPPSMMMQSWMGSDFTNDDLVRESSIVVDYTHKLLGTETIEGRKCYKIELTPKENAPVVWGKVLSWIDTEEFMQMKAEFFDEDGYLVNTMYGKNVKKMDDRLLPSILEVVPADEEGHKTIVEYLNLNFNKPIEESFFSVQNMKRVR
ncbi:MAG: outer membrane lipoprotein-sorting protein [Lewinellaceae bacterium]|nr:outer membrane lipoprotein-sorting protein [Phaeodactylibacter sp.]MCB9040233.1 outer membrane lipoprotein-sorting protein [Lewinellaceae bacterium]